MEIVQHRSQGMTADDRKKIQEAIKHLEATNLDTRYVAENVCIN